MCSTFCIRETRISHVFFTKKRRFSKGQTSLQFFISGAQKTHFFHFISPILRSQENRDPSKATFLEEGRKLSKKVTCLSIQSSVTATHKIDFFQNPGGVLLTEGPTSGTPGTVQIHESRLYVYGESKKHSFFTFF